METGRDRWKQAETSMERWKQLETEKGGNK
jgi:hypothetical protein